MTDQRPVSPEAAPPRATTAPLNESNEEACFIDLCADRLWRNGWELHARRLREIARSPRYASEEIGGLQDRLRWFEARAIEHELAEAGSAEEACHAEEREFQRAKILELFAQLTARASVDAREAERLRAALHEIAAWADREAHADSVHGDENSFACAIGDLARASLRATPPETTETEP